jgi:hypothetical protein
VRSNRIALSIILLRVWTFRPAHHLKRNQLLRFTEKPAPTHSDRHQSVKLSACRIRLVRQKLNRPMGFSDFVEHQQDLIEV